MVPAMPGDGKRRTQQKHKNALNTTCWIVFSSVNGIFTAVDLHHYNSFNLLKLKLLKQEVSECDFQNKLSSGGVYFVCSQL